MKNPYMSVVEDASNAWMNALEDESTPEQEADDWEQLRADPAAAGKFIERQVRRGRWQKGQEREKFQEYTERMEKKRRGEREQR